MAGAASKNTPIEITHAVISFLGTTLTKLVILNTIMQDYLEDGKPGGTVDWDEGWEESPILVPEFSAHGQPSIVRGSQLLL